VFMAREEWKREKMFSGSTRCRCHARSIIFPKSHTFSLYSARGSLSQLETFQFAIYCSKDQTLEIHFYSCDNRDSISAPVNSVVFAASKAFVIANFPDNISWWLEEEESSFSSAAILVAFYRLCFFLLSYMRMNYT
jgi:hypothetical protein